MSTANVEKFYATASHDQALIAQLTQGAETPEQFIERAVAAGNAQGFDFTYAEADAWVKSQQARSADGELSDNQLEAVAGGKGSVSSTVNSAASTVNSGVNTATNAINSGINTAGNAINSGIHTATSTVSNWFSSW